MTKIIGTGVVPAAAFFQQLIEINVTGDQTDYIIFNAAQAAGPHDPADNVTNGLIRITVSNGVSFSASNTSVAAVRAGSASFGSGWEVEFVVNGTDTARIQGAGGDGGDGESDNLVEGGGGGGGGAGDTPGTGGTGGGSPGNDGQDGTTEAGGAGGAPGASGGTTVSTNGSPGGPAIEIEAGANAPDIHLRPASGATLEVFAGGGGGAGAELTQSGANGGGPGLAGSNAGVRTGGAAGDVYVETGASVTEDGPGTIDSRGN